MRIIRLALPLVVVIVAFATAQERTTPPMKSQSGLTARAALVNASGETVGDAYFEETPNGVLLKVNLRDGQPGINGFHIHETGRCIAPAFESAGDHFAPHGGTHGFLNPDGPHAGDLPNAHVLVSGDTSFEEFVTGVTLRDGPASLLDADASALVMHAEPDDYRSDPGGGSGDRIACGVIMR